MGDFGVLDMEADASGPERLVRNLKRAERPGHMPDPTTLYTTVYGDLDRYCHQDDGHHVLLRGLWRANKGVGGRTACATYVFLAGLSLLKPEIPEHQQREGSSGWPRHVKGNMPRISSYTWLFAKNTG